MAQLSFCGLPTGWHKCALLVRSLLDWRRDMGFHNPARAVISCAGFAYILETGMRVRLFALASTMIMLLAAALTGWASDIDNCCFIDRQCQTDQQWTDGYWAFQSNQCSAPAQSQPVSSSPPASAAPAQIDNCCFVDRQCSSDQQWTDGYHAFQNTQCSDPGPAPPAALNRQRVRRRSRGAL